MSELIFLPDNPVQAAMLNTSRMITPATEKPFYFSAGKTGEREANGGQRDVVCT